LASFASRMTVSDDPTLARLITQAAEQSATFGHELDHIGRTQ